MTPETIILIIEYLSCTNIKPRKKSKKREIVEVRQIAQYAIRKKLHTGYRIIGKLCGNYNHATVVHNCKTVEILRLNRLYNEKYQGIFDILAI